MTIDLIQSADHIVNAGDTVLYLGEPYIVSKVEPRPRCSWFPERINNDQQWVLRPVEVLVDLERFDGMPR